MNRKDKLIAKSHIANKEFRSDVTDYDTHDLINRLETLNQGEAIAFQKMLSDVREQVTRLEEAFQPRKQALLEQSRWAFSTFK